METETPKLTRYVHFTKASRHNIETIYPLSSGKLEEKTNRTVAVTHDNKEYTLFDGDYLELLGNNSEGFQLIDIHTSESLGEKFMSNTSFEIYLPDALWGQPTPDASVKSVVGFNRWSKKIFISLEDFWVEIDPINKTYLEGEYGD